MTPPDIKKNGNSKVSRAARNGYVLIGTTLEDLIANKDSQGTTALHYAARHGCLPPNVTLQNLIDTKNDSGYTTLHEAARSGQFPPGTTAQHLATTTANNTKTALQTAAEHGHLPQDTTAILLKNNTDSYSKSAWDYLLSFVAFQPTQAIQLPHHLFKEDHQVAINAVNDAVKTNPTLKAQATLWLSKILAATDQNG